MERSQWLLTSQDSAIVPVMMHARYSTTNGWKMMQRQWSPLEIV